MPPTVSQQRGMAYAAIPFAVISCISSSYLIYHLLCKERQNRQLYHRLVLAMNVGAFVLSSTYAWAAFAVPEGTPHYAGASGTIQTCTANAFLWSMFSLTVPIYYASLSLAAYMGNANNFNEKKYRWIEIPIHVVAWCLPCALSIYPAVTDNYNPFGCGCAVAKAPQGCELDPNVPCERGDDIGNFGLIVGLGVVFIYFVFPPSVMAAMYVWLRKMHRNVDESQRTHQIREHARNQIMQETARQIYLYLFSFWFNIIPGLVHFGYQLLSGKMLYGLLIFATCMNAWQGFILAGVYFTLEKRGTQVESVPTTGFGAGDENNSVQEIRSHGAPSTENGPQSPPPDVEGNRETMAQPEGKRRRSFTGRKKRGSDTAEDWARFNIFCSNPEEDSPWAEFFRDEEDEPPPELPPELQWRPEEGDADKNLDLRTKLYLYENVLQI